ncbi:LysR family transcriptional regulator [bacterium Scap17]|nr:LysR family transcriptional regulator [bacterium Scap17]
MYRLDRTHWMLLAALQQSGTITLAAASLNITQSAASQRLGEAERRLGVSLVRKEGRALMLTPAGATIAKAATTTAPMLQAAESDAIWQGKLSRNRVRVAWSHFDPSRLASKLLTAGREMQPCVNVELVRVASEAPTSALNGQSADLMLAPGEGHGPRLTALTSMTLCQDRLVAVVKRDSALADKAVMTPEDFDGERFLTYDLRPEPGWEYETFFARGQRFPSQVSRVESTELICQLIASGQGASILPALCVEFSAWRAKLCIVELDVAPITFPWQIHIMPGQETEASLAFVLAETIVADMTTIS